MNGLLTRPILVTKPTYRQALNLSDEFLPDLQRHFVSVLFEVWPTFVLVGYDPDSDVNRIGFFLPEPEEHFWIHQ